MNMDINGAKIVGFGVNGWSGLRVEDANVVGPELVRLAEEGRSTPEDIVSAARSKSSPLHSFFTWDNRKAADKWRLQEARQIAASVTVKFETSDGKKHETRAFQAIKVACESGTETASSRQPQRHYLPTSVICQDVDKSAQVVQDAMSSLVGWYRRYQQYQTIYGEFSTKFGGVLHEVEQLLEEPAEDSAPRAQLVEA